MTTSGPRTLALIGSPAGERSTSEQLARYVLDALADAGHQTECLYVQKFMRTDAGVGQLLAAVAAADTLLLVFPLYVDAVPAPLTRLMERIADARRGVTARDKRLAAVVQCGFPEQIHTRLALAICERFAIAAGFEWVGGIGFGMGGMIGGRPLDKAPPPVRRVVESLDELVAACRDGRPLPATADSRLARPFLPCWLYTFIGTYAFKKRARAAGLTRPDLFRQPYA
jgi:multimeric flavodoxin WrbA